MSGVSYKQALETIKNSIDSSENLSEGDRENIAESLLEIKNPRSSGQLEKISLDFSPEQRDRLEAYLTQLENLKQSNMDQEVQQAIERARRLSDLRNQLKNRIHSAMDEAKELEQIANKLQDDGLGNIAGKEENEVKHLGKKLEQIDSKAEEVEKLEQMISSLLGQLGGKSLKEHLEIRESAVSQILQESSTKNGNTQSAQISQIANNLQDKLPELRKAENRGLQQLEEDIKTLSSIVEIEEQEIADLRQVENYLQDRNFSRASSTLNDLIQRRENLGDRSRSVQQIKQDLDEEKKIIIALQEFFNSIKQLGNKGITHDRLYQEMESRGSFSSTQDAKSFFEELELEFEDVEEDIARVKKLEQKERKLENLEHEKLKEIDQEDSQLRKNSSGEKRQELGQIHKKLQELGFSLENDISSSTSDNDSEENDDINLGGPGSDPWIICISDIESGLWILSECIGLADEALEEPLIELKDGGRPAWAGNNYELIINGDLFQHGRHAVGDSAGDQTRRLANAFESIVDSAEKQSGPDTHPVQFTVGNHDPRLIVDKPRGYPTDSELDALNGFRDTYQNWVDNGIVRMIIPGYNHYYLHAGQAHEWTKSEVQSANQLLKNVNGTQINQISPDDSKVPGDKGLSATKFSELQSRDIKIAKLFSAGDTSLGNGSGKNKHAGMIWARPNIVKNGPAQIVGHTGQKRPQRVGNLIIENTSAKKRPSIVIEKPNEVIAVWRDIESTDNGKINHGEIQVDRL